MPTDKFEHLDMAKMAKILSVALDEFARYRYQDASFNRIIRTCKMAKGTMYYYFNSKEDLFLTLYKATVREFAGLLRLAQKPIADSNEFWSRSRELIAALSAVLNAKPSTGLFITNFLKPSSWEDKHPAASTILAIDSWLLAFIRQGQALGALRRDIDEKRLSSLIWGIWEASRAPALQGNAAPPLEPQVLYELFSSLLNSAVSTDMPMFGGRRDLRKEAPSL